MASTAHGRSEFLGHAPSDLACPRDLIQWLREEFCCILPFRCVVALHGVTHSGGATPTHLLHVDFPLAHLQDIRNRAGALESPLAAKWMRERRAFVFDPKLHSSWPDLDREWLRSFHRNGLINAVVGGLMDEETCKATYLSFHGIPGSALCRAAQTLESWTKPLHEMMMRCAESASTAPTTITPRWNQLTPKELLIAKNAALGKSNLAIAMQLNLCESTVKTHLTHIFGKLNLKSRAELCVAFSACPPEGMRGIHVLT